MHQQALDAILATAKYLHIVDRAKKGSGRRSKYANVEWDGNDADMVHHYVGKVESTIRAMILAGYMPVPIAELATAQRPRKRVGKVRPVLRLSGVGGAIVDLGDLR